MAGMTSSNDYESDLLASYLRKGRLPTVRKTDVNLALSRYKAPAGIGTFSAKRARLIAGKTATYQNIRTMAMGQSDAALMKAAAGMVIAKNRSDRKTAFNNRVAQNAANARAAYLARVAKNYAPGGVFYKGRA